MRDLTIKGIEGVLPGGLPVVRKLCDERESACVLVRGGSGAGKTLFAAHLAISEAARRGGDVVYCLVEELPTELAAQLAGLTFGAERFAVPVACCAKPEARESAPPHLYAELIDVPADGEPDFGGELARAIETARAAGIAPAVVVVDALSEGYRIGRTVSRLLADGVAKYAADGGLVLILTEEIAGEPGGGGIEVERDAWAFAADVVIDLALCPDGQRTLVVRKNRFAPSAVAPYYFSIRSAGGIAIHPRRDGLDEEVAATTIRALRQRLHLAEPVYRAALELYGGGVPETLEARDHALRLAVTRARETERMIASGWTVSDLDLEELP